MSYWRSVVWAQATLIENKVNGVVESTPDRSVNSVGDAIKVHLQLARQATGMVAAVTGLAKRNRRPVRRRVLDWLQGASIAAAFYHLHAAEVLMIDLLPDDRLTAQIPSALARLRSLEATDRRREVAETVLSADAPADQRRAMLGVAVQQGYDEMDAQHARVRSFRNIVLAGALALALVTAVVCVIGALDPEAIPLCIYETSPAPPASSGPTTTTTSGPATTPPRAQGQSNLVPVACPASRPTPRRTPAPSAADVALVALFGLVGGALSAAVSIRNLRGTSTPYSIPVALALLKLPSGALTAVMGLLLVQADFIPGLSQLDSQEQILAYAVVFGFAQQIVTRFLDRRAQEVLDKVPSKESGPGTAAPPPQPQPQPQPQPEPQREP